MILNTFQNHRRAWFELWWIFSHAVEYFVVTFCKICCLYVILKKRRFLVNFGFYEKIFFWSRYKTFLTVFLLGQVLGSCLNQLGKKLPVFTLDWPEGSKVKRAISLPRQRYFVRWQRESEIRLEKKGSKKRHFFETHCLFQICRASWSLVKRALLRLGIRDLQQSICSTNQFLWGSSSSKIEKWTKKWDFWRLAKWV